MSEEQIAGLTGRLAERTSVYPKATFSPTRLVWDFDPEDDDDYEDDFDYDFFSKDEDEDEDEEDDYEDEEDEEDEDRPPRPGPLIGDREREELLCSYFDACLEFEAGGARRLTFRVPAGQSSLQAVEPYLTPSRIDGLDAWVRDSSLLLSFRHYEEDGELTHWRERPDTWLKPLLPLRADLASGDVSAAYLGWLKAVQEARDRDTLQPPPRPAALREMSPR